MLKKMAEDFCQKLGEAIIAEEKAAKDYDKLMGNLVEASYDVEIEKVIQFSEAAKEILEVYADEKDHAKIIIKIKEKLCK